MRAPFSLRWAHATPRYREPQRGCSLKPAAGVLIVGSLCFLVLLVTATTVSGSLENATNCPIRGDASDIASRAVVSPQIVQGVLIDKRPMSSTSYRATFRVLRVQKKYRGPRRVKKRRLIALEFRSPGPNISASEHCLVRAKLETRRKYFLFLSGPMSKRERVRPVAPPVKVSKRVRRRIKSVLCDDCAFSPSVGRLRDDSVVRGNPVNLTCVFDGHPSPKISWRKNDQILEPSSAISIVLQKRKLRRNGRTSRRRKKRIQRSNRRKENRVQSQAISRRKKQRKKRPQHPRVKILSTLSIYEANDTHAGSYSCHGKSVLGEATARASLRVVAPLDPGDVYPCPYDSYCMNGGTCMFFKLFGELVCQCAKGYKGQRCHEKAVYPSYAFRRPRFRRRRPRQG